MAITLGDMEFDSVNTAVKETHEEVGGRRGRVVELSGLIVGLSTVAAVHAVLDAVLSAASAEDYSAALSLRQGRRLWVRRTEFVRHVNPEALTGSFLLKLGSLNPFEESTALNNVSWSVSAPVDTIALSTVGTAPALPAIRLTALGNLINPSFSDGVKSISYAGTLAPSDVLIFDSAAGIVTLNNDDVTPYVSGDFPEIAVTGSVFTYTDAPGSSHLASISIEYRDRWW